MPRTRPLRPASPRMRGGILLELLLSIAIFVATAMFTLSAMRSALDGMRRAETRARAADLAATRLAELDAGLVSVGDIGEERAEDDRASDGPETDDALVVELENVAAPDDGVAVIRAVVRNIAAEDRPIVFVEERVVEPFARRRQREGAR